MRRKRKQNVWNAGSSKTKRLMENGNLWERDGSVNSSSKQKASVIDSSEEKTAELSTATEEWNEYKEGDACKELIFGSLNWRDLYIYIF